MLIRLDFGGDVPIYLQLRNQMVVAIAAGQLAPGERLPTVRDLAEELGVNMMTVSKAYQLLRQEGYITTDRRSGARVAVCPGGGPEQETVEGLRLRLCELRLAGLDREEVLARRYPTGEVREVIPGAWQGMPDGQVWLLR